MPTARDRFELVAAQSGLRVPDDAVQVQSWSNDAWRCGDVYVRVCFRGDPSRLSREAMIGAALPAEVGYPRVLDHGAVDDMTWMIVERLDGVAYSDWRSRPEAEVRRVMEQLVDVLRVVHAWSPPADVLAVLRAHADDEPALDPDVVIGHDILPLPTRRMAALVDAAHAHPSIDSGLVRAVVARIEELAAHDPFVSPGDRIVHGDLNFDNLLVRDGDLVALLDYEWARLGPRDAELVQLLRSSRRWSEDEPSVPTVGRWLEELYPEMFAAPDVRERVWLCELAYMLRQLVLWPPGDNDAEFGSSHPVNCLPRLVDGPWEY